MAIRINHDENSLQLDKVTINPPGTPPGGTVVLYIDINGKLAAKDETGAIFDFTNETFNWFTAVNNNTAFPTAPIGTGLRSITLGNNATSSTFTDTLALGTGVIVSGNFGIALGANSTSSLRQTTVGTKITASSVGAGKNVDYALRLGYGDETDTTNYNLLNLYDSGKLELYGAEAQFIMPNYTTVNIPATTVLGGVVYDTTTNELKVYDGAWTAIGSGGGATVIDDLTDVTVTTPATGQVLTYNETGSFWENTTPGAGVTDHGLLSGLADDDHTQYHTDARGDLRYVELTGDTMTGDLTVPNINTPGLINITASQVALTTADSLYKFGGELYWGDRRLTTYIERIIPNVSADPVDLNLYYEIGSFVFSSLQGIFSIDVVMAGSGGGQTFRYALPTGYAMDYSAQYGLSANNNVWMVLTPMFAGPRHYFNQADDVQLQYKANLNTIEFRLFFPSPSGATSSSLTAHVKIYHSDDFDNSTYTELTGTGTDATVYDFREYIASGLTGTTLFGNEVTFRQPVEFQGTPSVVSTTPRMRLSESDAALDSKNWEFYVSSGGLALKLFDDSLSGNSNAFLISRTGTVVDNFSITHPSSPTTPTDVDDLTRKDYVDGLITSHTHAVDDLTDVTNTTPSDKDILIYDGITDNKYENRQLVEADISDLGTEIVTKTDIASLTGDITMNGGNF